MKSNKEPDVMFELKISLLIVGGVFCFCAAMGWFNV
jgi:hypothetical protein